MLNTKLPKAVVGTMTDYSIQETTKQYSVTFNFTTQTQYSGVLFRNPAGQSADLPYISGYEGTKGKKYNGTGTRTDGSTFAIEIEPDNSSASTGWYKIRTNDAADWNGKVVLTWSI